MMRNMVQETPPRRKRAEQMKNKILMVNGRVKHQKPSPLERAVEENAKRLSLISQVRNVFPELGEGFVEACLISLNENPETVINHLLENTLPGDLEILDRSLPRLPTQFNRGVENMETDLVEESPLANRHNIFDDDEEFNVFSGRTVDLSRLHQGKKNRGTAERLLDDKSFVDSYRESIIENAYNMYEDEYDDTYDTSGLKTGAVDIHLLDELEESQDSQRHGDQIDPGIIHESELIKTYTTDPSVFERTNQVRKSKKREELRRITQMTDEQLEGWFIMFQRNPRKDRLLEKYEWRGQQEFLDNDEDQSSSQSERYAATSNQGRGRGNTRGKAPHRGGEGGNTASRAQKERHKGRGANHNRKNAHSRKMGKGFGSLPLDS
ncbi:hypothetical protein G9A89_015862 [Geosiphon pyriformis]|nr:hypothetical protein G9A89_015862 [Geosiphon pyriformis]